MGVHTPCLPLRLLWFRCDHLHSVVSVLALLRHLLVSLHHLVFTVAAGTVTVTVVEGQRLGARLFPRVLSDTTLACNLEQVLGHGPEMLIRGHPTAHRTPPRPIRTADRCPALF